MSFEITPEAIALVCAAAVALGVALASLRRTAVHGGIALSLMMCAVCVWSLGSAMEAGSRGVPHKLFFAVCAYAGTVNVAPLFLLFALRYRRKEWRPAWWHLVFLWLIPAVTLVLAATNGEHGLVWSRLAPGPAGTNILLYEPGPWYFVAVIYYAALGLAAAILIGRAALRAQRMFVWQTAILLTGLLIPWLAAALMYLPFNPLPGVDLPPIAFAVTGFLLLIGMRRFSLLDLVPVARDHVVEKMSDGFVVLDAQGRLVDINPAARALLNGSDAAIGAPVDQVLGALGGALEGLRGRTDDHLELSLPGDPERHLDLRASDLLDRAGNATGRLLVIRDVTERRRLELEKEELIRELQEALADVKTLSGLLPICASCKKIRDDHGYWLTVEKFLSDHSGAQFSHGLCDDCLRKLYPELSGEGPETSR
ncbi:MAG: histidine kinase N-terminal 7TM domain-containing protein [Spirochaetia bacterium]|jgi:PAS domain-containing protein